LYNTNYEEQSSSAKIHISELDTLDYHYLIVDGHYLLIYDCLDELKKIMMGL